ncbi:MAG: outer membrane lipoprotein carrier protein LolA [Gammaproteobacteria bacterium]|nr:outer membrane lipoprotein carrier protein LolA [Gammaproteobacteria bacterium]
MSDHVPRIRYSRAVSVVAGVFFGFMASICPADVSPDQGHSAEWTIRALMSRLANVETASIEFTETKQSVLLFIDTVSSGQILYRSPDYIEKRTVSPFTERVVIDGDSMIIDKTLTSGHDQEKTVISQVYSVDSHPVLKASIESFRNMISGNYEALHNGFRLNLSGPMSGWNLKLVPDSENALAHIKEINLTGSGAFLRRIVTVQADDDQTILELAYRKLKYHVFPS